MGVLRDRMIEEMKLRNFSTATQESYVYAVSRLARYHHKSPDQLSKEDIRAFLVHLTIERKLSPNSLTGYCSGLRFFYNETLRWDVKLCENCATLERFKNAPKTGWSEPNEETPVKKNLKG